MTGQNGVLVGPTVLQGRVQHQGDKWSAPAPLAALHQPYEPNHVMKWLLVQDKSQEGRSKVLFAGSVSSELTERAKEPLSASASSFPRSR